MTRVWSAILAIIVVCAAGRAAAWQVDRANEVTVRTKPADETERQWELVFEDGISADEYAKQVDFLKIEIAAISKNGKIEYTSAVTKNKPEKRVSFLESEYRLRIGWKSGTLHAVDRKLLRKAGINSDKKELTHYFPIAAQKQMEVLEHEYAGRKPDAICRTRFQVRRKEQGAGYELVVIEQDPPKPAEKSPSANESSNQPASRP